MTVKNTDQLLWEKWNRSRSDSDLQALLTQLQPLLLREVSRWSGSLPKPLLSLQAKILATEAIQSYNPSVGAALATHVTNRLQKLSRFVYSHSQAARLPEHKALGMASFNAANELLHAEQGRPPTAAELADHLGWGTKRVEEFQKAYNRKELLTSGEFDPSMFPIADTHDPLVSFVYHDMSPLHQQVFEHVTGYGGKEQLTNPQIMKRLNITQGQLSYAKTQLKNMFEAANRPKS